MYIFFRVFNQKGISFKEAWLIHLIKIRSEIK